MKWSRYNLLFKTKQGEHLLYNSLSNSFVLLDSELYEYLIRIQKKEHIREEDIAPNMEFSFSEMSAMKILTENDDDEISKIKFSRRHLRFKNDALLLTINPTLDCNFACDYCFEGGKVKGIMTQRTCDSVLKFIKSYQNISAVAITWFGGEPLLAPKVMDYLTKGIKDSGLDISAEIITNGYLLSPRIAEKLSEWNVQFLQITIDGPPEIHDNRRPLKNGNGTFEQIIRNIDYTLRNTQKLHIAIRVNIDKRNQDTFIEIYNFLRKKFMPYMKKNRLNVYPGFVEPSSGCPSINNCVFSRENKQAFLFETFAKSGMVAFPFYPTHIESECAVRNVNTFVIGPNGELYKCWNDVGREDRVIANINKKGIRNDQLHFDYLAGADPLDHPDCLECFLLPVCSGGCPYQRLMAKSLDDLKKCCILQKDNLQGFLEKHYSFKKSLLNNPK